MASLIAPREESEIRCPIASVLTRLWPSPASLRSAPSAAPAGEGPGVRAKITLTKEEFVRVPGRKLAGESRLPGRGLEILCKDKGGKSNAASRVRVLCSWGSSERGHLWGGGGGAEGGRGSSGSGASAAGVCGKPGAVGGGSRLCGRGVLRHHLGEQRRGAGGGAQATDAGDFYDNYDNDAFVARFTADLAAAPPPCAGDCSGDAAVSIEEIVTMVNIALGSGDTSACAAGDVNGDGESTVEEIAGAVNRALNGCP